MSQLETMSWERKGKIVRIVLNRPEMPAELISKGVIQYSSKSGGLI